ncbi:MAG: hypothetical protein IJE85_05500 [Bacteroidales bacterium]|nr:hypothetical protein [Bacteroidales bacterium]
MTPCIAIIDRNTLGATALRNILWNTFSNVEVHLYNSMDSFIRDSNRHFIHFFIESDILFRHIDEFITLRKQTTVLSMGRNRRFAEEGFNILDISMSEAEITDRLLHIQLISRFEDPQEIKRNKGIGEALSSREKEVLKLMIKGLINKEIAQQLEISVTTVIFHRNNICEKLQTRSIGKLTIFAVLSGIIDINEI